MAPGHSEAKKAISNLEAILYPRRNSGRGRKYPNLTPTLSHRLLLMKAFLWHYTENYSTMSWTAASKVAVRSLSKSDNSESKFSYSSRRLRSWTSDFIRNPERLPIPGYGHAWQSKIVDPELQASARAYLKVIGKYVAAKNLVDFTKQPAIQHIFQFSRPISLATARRWMPKIGFQWRQGYRGMYIDGHERADVVKYRQEVFIPRWRELLSRTREWDKDGKEIPKKFSPGTRVVVFWFQDESVFYQYDKRKKRWVIVKEECPEPETKGEGYSIMVSDFVSADHGFLRSPDGKEEARLLFRPGKNRDGYFQNEDFISHVEHAMDILTRHFPDEDHILFFDNAPNHLKRSPTAPSATKAILNPSKVGVPWGPKVKKLVNGKVQHNLDGTPKMVVARMEDGFFSTGVRQPFYYPDNHPTYPGCFKGMRQILIERGCYTAEALAPLHAQCRDFECKTNDYDICCVRKILYNEPDFKHQPPIVEEVCRNQGFEILFTPKFHCEVSFLEQCWCNSKQRYREYPPAATEDEIESDIRRSLDEIPITTMRRYLSILVYFILFKLLSLS